MQNFLPLRLRSGVIDGGIFIYPEEFTGEETQAELLEGHGYVEVSFHYSPLAQRVMPFARVSTQQEADKSYRVIPGYLDHATATSAYYRSTWNANLQSLSFKDKTNSLIEEYLTGTTVGDGSTIVQLPLDFDDTAAIIEENGGLFGEEFAPNTGGVIVSPDDFGERTFTTTVKMGGTFTVLLVEEVRFIHSQTTDQNTWAIAHNLGSFPIVSVVDGSTPLLGRVEHIDVNNLTVSFSQPRSGEAHVGF